MSNNFFRFKQFTVFQDCCAMKVGTDGVLLGAWTETFKRNNVLDVGTGTGLIALMIAQRNTNATIDAIDIDEGCVMQAKKNVHESRFAHRVVVQKSSFQDFSTRNDNKYNLIVSNPPYFHNSLKSPSLHRNYARHADSLSFYDIISHGVSLLAEGGRISLILPYEFKSTVLMHAKTVDLFAKRITNVFPLPHKPAKRILVEFGMSDTECVEDDLVIELSRHKYTDEYNALTNEFYLQK